MCIIKITVCDSTTRDSSITHYAIQQIKEVHWATSQNVQATKAKKKKLLQVFINHLHSYK